MHDPLAMRGGQPASDLEAEVLRGRQVESLTVEPRAQTLSLDQLHGDVDAPVGLVDLVHDGDVGVGDGGGRASLSEEPLTPLLVTGGVD